MIRITMTRAQASALTCNGLHPDDVREVEGETMLSPGESALVEAWKRSGEPRSLAVRDTRELSEVLSCVVDTANAEDAASLGVGGFTDAESRRSARRARESLTNLAAKLRRVR